MTIGPINTSALFGIQRGFDGLRANAAKIASASSMSGGQATTQSPPDLARTLVGLQENSRNVQASVKAFSAQDRMIGVLLDELA
jgi:flagellar hook protein FlgE